MPRKNNNNGGLAEAVREKRGERSFRSVAKEVNVVHSVIQFAEKGRVPMPKLWLRLLKFIDVIDQKEYDRLNDYTK